MKDLLFFKEIIENISIVVLLALTYTVLSARLKKKQIFFHILSGLFISIISITAMMVPVKLAEGVVFDGRSIILTIGAYFFGPVATIISASMSIAYRIYMGGTGTLPGSLVILSTSGLGFLYYYLKRKHPFFRQNIALFSLAMLSHIIMLTLMLLLPEQIRFKVISTVAIPALTVYPGATFLISLYLRREEERMESILRLRDSEQILKGLISNMPVLLGAFDEKNNIIVWNRQFELASGYSAEEAMQPGFLEKLYPDKKYRNHVYNTLKKLHGDFYEQEFTLTAKNGQKKIISWSNISYSFPVSDWPTWAIGVDVTKRKHAEESLKHALEEKNILLKEIHHRVKNNMQTIASIINLQMLGCQDETTIKNLEAASYRILAMGLLHKNLYQSQFLDRIDLKSYLENLIEGMKQFYTLKKNEISFYIDIEKLYIGLDLGVPLGLIINEIVTNSVKHAFPENDGGTISILGEKQNGEYLLEIGDNGIGISKNMEQENNTTLGLQLIRSLLKQIDASVDIDKEDGTLYKIRFKYEINS